ncbi:NAD+ synthase [bacterium]|nr:NAD+ synthase [bacterium]
MKIALGQINTVVGDFEGNSRKILSAASLASSRGADLAVFPELALPGYPPRDLVLRAEFVSAAGRALAELSRRAPLPLLVGTLLPNRSKIGNPLFNAAAYVQPRRPVRTFARKMLIPTYDVFDELRYFEPSDRPTVLSVGGYRIGVSICEDIWNEDPFLARPLRKFIPVRRYAKNPVGMLKKMGFDLLVNLSASPFELGKATRRLRLLRSVARKCHRPVALVNLVGGNDELLFDGNSLAVDASGTLLAQGRAFSEDVQVVDFSKSARVPFSEMPRAEEAYEALVMGTRDYARKTGFRSAVLGLSGGIDSSVTACVAAAALGPKNVTGVLMPGPFSSKGSIRDAELLARALGISAITVPISPPFRAFQSALRPVFKGLPRDVTEENLQARIRGTLLMAVSNKFGHLLLTTGNKSELSVGYCTLYGDMCGGLAVISDVPKMLVYEIGRHINRLRRVIPEAVFTKAPSAELRPNQTDQDSLPPYSALDAFIDDYVEWIRPAPACGPRRMPAALREKLAADIDRAEYKRRQAAPGLRITRHAFGYGRRLPIARK